MTQYQWRSKAWVFGRWIAGVAGSNPAVGMDVLLLCLLYFVEIVASATGRSPIKTSPIGCVCVILCDLEPSRCVGLGLSSAVVQQKN
jgi:hypothetical protein